MNFNITGRKIKRGNRKDKGDRGLTIVNRSPGGNVMTLVASTIAGDEGFKDLEGAAMLLALGEKIMMI